MPYLYTMAPSHKSDEFVYDSESGSDYEDAAFAAPKNYEKIPMLDAKVALDNKEVWLIETPKNFPLAQLKTLPVLFTAKHVADDAVETFDVELSSYQVNELRFAGDAAKYKVLHKDMMLRKIDRFYSIREVVRVPEIDFAAAVKPREDVAKVENLRMRHFATGYSAQDFDEAKPIPASRLDADGKVLKRAKVEKKEKKEKAEKGDKKEKKEKKHKKEKKDKKKKDT